MSRPPISRELYKFDYCNPHHTNISWCILYRGIREDKSPCPLTCYYAKRMEEIRKGQEGNLERRTEL